jgi:hypothetical protein
MLARGDKTAEKEAFKLFEPAVVKLRSTTKKIKNQQQSLLY